MLKRVALAGILLTIFIFSIRPITDNDLWWHLAAGKYMVENQKILESDPFSYTNYGRVWIDHEWLSQIIFFFVHEGFGAPGLVVLKSLIVVLAFCVLYLRSRLHMGVLFSIITLYVAASLSWNAWLERPMIFTFLFISIILYLLDLYDKGATDRLFLIPALMPLWANLHGGFILGILITLIYSIAYLFAGEKARSKKLFLISGISVAISAVNPYTYHLLLYPFQYSYQNVHSLFIQEWQSPTFHAISVYEIVLLGAILVFAKSRATNTHILLTLAFAHFSLFAIRNISLFAMVVTPIVLAYTEKYLIRALGSSEPEFNMVVLKELIGKAGLRSEAKMSLLDRFLPVFLYVIVILAFLVPLFNYLLFGPAFDTSPRGFPENAVRYLLEQKPEGNLFNLYGWGGYVIWRAYPQYKVFIDGRADMYGDFVYEYISVQRLGSNWREIFEKYGVRVVLMPVDQPLDVLLKEAPEWVEAYRDQTAVVYTLSKRNTTPSSES